MIFRRSRIISGQKCVVIIFAFTAGGVVCGLAVTQDPKDFAVMVEPGYAINCHEEEIFICEPLGCKLNANISVGYVSLSVCEMAAATIAGSPEFARVEEGVSIQFGTQPPEGTVILARMKRVRKRWTLDRGFRTKMATLQMRRS